MRNPISSFFLPSFLIVILLHPACGIDDGASVATDPASAEEAEQVSQSPINGQVDIVGGSCTDAERFQIDLAMDAMLNGKNGLNTSEFKACLADAVFANEPWASPEEVLVGLKQNMPTAIRCVDPSTVKCGGSNNWQGCAGIGTTDESLSLAKSMLADPSTVSKPEEATQYIASVILHEVVHNKGFTHIDGYEYAWSVNQHVLNCFLKDAVAWFTPAMFPQALRFRRNEMPDETELAPVGLGGGAPFQMACYAKSQFVRGISGSYGDNGPTGGVINSLNTTCSTYSDVTLSAQGATAMFTPLGQTGTYFASDCAMDEVATGVWGKAGNVVDRLGLRCSKFAAVMAGAAPTPRSLPLVGGKGGTWVKRDCPAGMAVKEIRGRAGSKVDQLRLVCRSVRFDAVLPEPYKKTTTIFGKPVNQVFAYPMSGTKKLTSLHYESTCVGNSALVGLFGRDGAEIDRLGGICKKRLMGRGEVGLDAADPREHIAPATIGWAGDAAFEERCPIGMALKGMMVFTRQSARVVWLAGLCVNAAKWLEPAVRLSGFDNAVLSPKGTAYTTDKQDVFECPRGKLLYGFESWSSNSKWPTFSVHGLRPICR